MLKELLEKERQHLNFFLDQLDITAVEQVVELLRKCLGSIIFTGIGKSGLVAKKIAVTMTSTGSRAMYLSPANALHGDIGVVNENDVFVMISKSGESDELLNLVPFVRNKGAKLLAIVCNGTSRLSKACDFNLVLPFEKELCPFDMAPTISTVSQMILGDLLTIALMRIKNFTINEYAMNHPAGRLGKRITVKVGDLMIKGNGIPVCRPNDKLTNILEELSNKRCGCILIVDENMILQGVFTDGDLRRALLDLKGGVLDSPMHQLMICSPKFIAPHVLAWEALQLMEADQKNPILFLPVLEADKRVIGLIKMHDIVQAGI